MTERWIAVAYSGGRDSTALLHATVGQAALDGVQVLALHVHHGLSPNADAWLDHAATTCARWARRGLPLAFAATRLTSAPARGESVEAWARQERYRALREMALAGGASVILLAHHRRDQAETFLLQALRGAGVAGLSGMPRRIERDGITWERPWLDRPRAEIEAYLRRHRLSFIEDDSNTELRFARNRLRHAVWPALSGAFEQAEAALADSAAWAQHACAVLDEVAVLDLAQIAAEGDLVVDGWLALSPARRGNALRAWLRRAIGAPAPASLIERLGVELPVSRTARWPVHGGVLRAYRGRLSFVPAAETTIDRQRETHLSVQRVGRFALPGWGGTLKVARVEAGGVPLAWLGRLDLQPRLGGETFQAGIGRPPRSLKKQFQAARIPDDERAGPLVYSGEQLVFVPGLGVDARVIGLPGQALVSLAWLPDARPA
ncbi:MAG: tRNA lysidine(34) synthetase TilS [Pseudomonadota bacterium]